MLICGSMAFEDRSSPSTAASPHNHQKSPPNSPESTRTSPYTCTTISFQRDAAQASPKENDKPFFRITSFALSSHETSTSPGLQSFRTCTTDVDVASPGSPSGSVKSFTTSTCSRSPPPEEPTIQTLKYSIRNILQPDFGKSAVQKTKTQPKIGFKPYESDAKPFPAAPLGSLCQAVSQIGKGPVRVPETPRAKSPVAKPLPAAEEAKGEDGKVPTLWPAWVYCTRYSDRPSSGPRSRRIKKPNSKSTSSEDKRPRTAFSAAQLARLKQEFAENRYLTERRRQQLSAELGLNEAQIKIWFQNKRAKIKKASGQKNPLALQLMAQGLYNHSTVPCDEDDMPMSS